MIIHFINKIIPAVFRCMQLHVIYVHRSIEFGLVIPGYCNLAFSTTTPSLNVRPARLCETNGTVRDYRSKAAGSAHCLNTLLLKTFLNIQGTFRCLFYFLLSFPLFPSWNSTEVSIESSVLFGLGLGVVQWPLSPLSRSSNKKENTRTYAP